MSRATHIMYKLVQTMKSYGFGFTPTFPRSALRRFWTPAVTPSIKRESNMNMMPIGVDVDVPPFYVTSKWTRIEGGVRENCGNREFFKVQRAIVYITAPKISRRELSITTKSMHAARQIFTHLLCHRQNRRSTDNGSNLEIFSRGVGSTTKDQLTCHDWSHFS